MFEVVFLFGLALVWMVFAVVQDIKTREIANWLNFSLIIFAMGFRFFYSVFNQDFGFFYQGVLGMGIFFILGNLLYHSRLFAGGDAKLMIALGAILPIHENFYLNLDFFILFFMIFLFIGAVYTLIVSLFFSLRNFESFRKEYEKEIRKYKIIYSGTLALSILFLILGFFEFLFLGLGILLFVFLNLYLYSKAVDESSMIKKVKPKELTEGDWLYRSVKVGNKLIKANWEGLKEKDIKLLKEKFKAKTILIRQGIPFSPVFLISFLILVWFWSKGITKFLF